VKKTHSQYKHGHFNTPTWRSWSAMKARCFRPTATAYDRYGGRGISVCERWRVNFENFLADMGERPHGTSLDRIDNDGDYEPGNCRWATPKQQTQNQRTAANAVMLTMWGETRCVSEWARTLGMDDATIAYRINAGWPVEKALTRAPASRTQEIEEAAKVHGVSAATIRRWIRQGRDVLSATKQSERAKLGTIRDIKLD